MTTHGQVAYEAYAAHQAHKNYMGASIPPWSEVRADIAVAWEVAADAVVIRYQQEETQRPVHHLLALVSRVWHGRRLR